MRRQTELNRFDHVKLALIGNTIVSLGIIMVTAGGSWDITNHILNKPETFFAPPHTVLYSGVATALFGFLILYVAWRRYGMPQELKNGIKISGLGIGLLLTAGPADFLWHSHFGLDGLLSPPHLVLISGMILSAVGALISSTQFTRQSNKLAWFVIVISLIPVWLSVTGLFYSFSLPFSETDYFDFNPHPVFAAVFASLSYPFLISTILVMASILSGNRFGVASIVGGSYLAIMSLTAILPNDSIADTIPFYFLNVIPIVVGDLVISRGKGTKAPYIAGAIFGSSFFLMYYPLITYTYNEILFERVMWPSLTAKVYFEMFLLIIPILACVGAVTGVFGAKFARKLDKIM
jgi:hypothetical protein